MDSRNESPIHFPVESVALRRARDFYSPDTFREAMYSPDGGKGPKKEIFLWDVYAKLYCQDLEKTRYDGILQMKSGELPSRDPLGFFKPDTATGEFLAPSSEETYADYWKKHSSKYLQRLDNLIRHPANIDQARAIVAIPAMNEDSLEHLIEVLRKDYGEGFDRDILILIYHNYKSPLSIPDAVKKSVEACKRNPNVMVVGEKVPQYNNTGMAKKVVSDLAIRMIGPKMDKALIMVDADVTGMTPGLLRRSIDVLDEPYALAASPELDYGPEVRKKYPVLDLIWKIRRELAVELSKALPAAGNHMTYGQFYSIMPRTLCLLGGIKPFEQFEDKQLTSELNRFTYRGEFTDIRDASLQSPVFPLNTEGYAFYTDPSRELNSLRQGDLQWARWGKADHHYKVTSMTRHDTASAVPDNEIPEFGVLSDASIAAALNRSRPLLMPDVDVLGLAFGLSYETVYSRCMMQTLAKHGIAIRGCRYMMGDDKNTMKYSEDIDGLYSGWQSRQWFPLEISSVSYNQ